jgi:hypothetical protein
VRGRDPERTTRGRQFGGAPYCEDSAVAAAIVPRAPAFPAGSSNQRDLGPGPAGVREQPGCKNLVIWVRKYREHCKPGTAQPWSRSSALALRVCDARSLPSSAHWVNCV